jgi:antibiotic biosynthesis monooxygenase (ABM) superfamily enzyme
MKILKRFKAWLAKQENRLSEKQKKVLLILFYLFMLILCFSLLKTANKKIPFVFSTPM